MELFYCGIYENRDRRRDQETRPRGFRVEGIMPGRWTDGPADEERRKARLAHNSGKRKGRKKHARIVLFLEKGGIWDGEINVGY